MAQSGNGFQSGNGYQSQLNAGLGVASFATMLFAQIGGNSKADHYRIKHDDVVVEDIARDNRSLIVAGATFALAIAMAIIFFRK